MNRSAGLPVVEFGTPVQPVGRHKRLEKSAGA
jgi:hypothetical protein